MGIGGFGTGPASKFATDKRAKLPSGTSRCFIWDFSTGERPAIRSGSAGLGFQKGSLRCRFPLSCSYRSRLPTRALKHPTRTPAAINLDRNAVDQSPKTGPLPLANRAPNHVGRDERGRNICVGALLRNRNW
jgi:hypothetical protein